MRTRIFCFVSVVGLAFLLAWAVKAQGVSVAANSTTERVSISSGGVQGNNHSEWASISADGRYAVFASKADNLVSSDTNGVQDVFIHDRQTGQTNRVSVASNGAQADGASYASYGSAISADGRYVAFASYATNLVSGDTNMVEDVFVHDRQTGQTSRVSVASGGAQGNWPSQLVSISADGRCVSFFSNATNLVSGDTNGTVDVFVHDRQTGQTTRVSVASDGTQANGLSWVSAISADGRYVAFESDASNLVSGDTNNVRDVFVHDRQTGQTTRVSVASNGAQGNGRSWWSAISADGRYVAFESSASNLISDDTNNASDIFVHDRQTGQTTRVSVAWDGQQASGAYASTTSYISGDGRCVAFYSGANNLVSGDTNNARDVFVHDRGQGEAATQATIPVSGGNLTSWPYHTTLTFSPGTFTATVMVTCTGYFPIRYSPPVSMTDIGHSFDLTGAYTDTSQPAQPTRPYTITVQYTEDERGQAIENTLALYYWNGSLWVKEPSSVVDAINDAVIAAPNHFSSWAVLGETRTQTVFLPVILKSFE